MMAPARPTPEGRKAERALQRAVGRVIERNPAAGPAGRGDEKRKGGPGPGPGGPCFGAQGEGKAPGVNWLPWSGKLKRRGREGSVGPFWWEAPEGVLLL
jgi:hypothetical protein